MHFSTITLALAISSLTNARTLHFSKRQTVDVGTCGSPGIEFANGLDGRTQPAFEPIDESSFNHGSALNIGVITSFIVGQLKSPCNAPDSTLQLAAQASAAAEAAPSGGAQADAWNKFFGIDTDFASVGAGSSSDATSTTTPSTASVTAAATSASNSNVCVANKKKRSPIKRMDLNGGPRK